MLCRSEAARAATHADLLVAAAEPAEGDRIQRNIADQF